MKIRNLISVSRQRRSGLDRTISPHKLRHFLLTWLKQQGLNDALIQPYSGHASRQSLELSSRLSIAAAQQEYDRVILKFPVQSVARVHCGSRQRP